MNTIKKTTEMVTVGKEIKKMEKALESMKKNSGVSADAIAQQETALVEKKSYLEKLTKQAEAKQGLYDKDRFLTFSVVDDETGKVTKKQYKVAFVKNNRPIDKNKVNGFIRIIANGKYEKHAPIFAITAKEAIESGYEVTDVKGNKVELENADDYLVILDGQHRTLAFLMCNMTKPWEVPSTFIKTGIDIGQYIVDINDVGTSWNQKDRFAVAALVTTDELAHEIADRISEGFNPTTPSLIYTGKKITAKQVKMLLRGEQKKWMLPEDAKLDIPRGNKFVQLCKEANMSVRYITNRYFITGFNAFARQKGDEAAFEQLKKCRFTEKELKAVKDGTDFEAMLEKAA
jgi:hypothetical protein